MLTFNDLEMKLAQTSSEARNKIATKREANLQENVTVYLAYKRGYKKSHLAKALNTSLMNITIKIRTVEEALQIADSIRAAKNGVVN